MSREGATLLTGDGAIGGPNGTLIRPVVLTDVTTGTDIFADEPMAPFGGVRNTGYGRFGGTAGIESFTEQRWVMIQHTGRPAYPF